MTWYIRNKNQRSAFFGTNHQQGISALIPPGSVGELSEGAFRALESILRRSPDLEILNGPPTEDKTPEATTEQLDVSKPDQKVSDAAAEANLTAIEVDAAALAILEKATALLDWAMDFLTSDEFEKLKEIFSAHMASQIVPPVQDLLTEIGKLKNMTAEEVEVTFEHRLDELAEGVAIKPADEESKETPKEPKSAQKEPKSKGAKGGK